MFKFLGGSLLSVGIPSVGEQDTVHPVTKLEYLVIVVGFYKWKGSTTVKQEVIYC